LTAYVASCTSSTHEKSKIFLAFQTKLKLDLFIICQ